MLQLKSKVQAGFTIIELLIVIAIIGILATLVLTNFQGAQARGRDTVRSSDINSIFSKLEEYYNNNSGYPLGTAVTSAAAQTTFPGIDSTALVDEDGDDIVVSYEVVDIAGGGTPTLPDATDTEEYRIHFYGTPCSATEACAKYTILGYQETDPTNDIVKNSLN